MSNVVDLKPKQHWCMGCNNCGADEFRIVTAGVYCVKCSAPLSWDELADAICNSPEWEERR